MNVVVEDVLDTAESRQPKSLRDYHRIVLLTEGFSDPFYAKTAMSLLRYRGEDVVAVYDAANAGRNAGDLLSVGGKTPIVDSFDGLHADALFLGIAAPGGRLPTSWRKIIMSVVEAGMDVVSGNHDFLSDDAQFVKAASNSGANLIDVRKNNHRSISTGVPLRPQCLRIHTVGQDCSLGKMVVALEVQRHLAAEGHDAQFIATGQTGIMILGQGIPVDCVVSDFVNGATEALIRQNEQHDILLVEGQGSLAHPSYSAVTTGLLHGCAPQGLIYCYEVGRREVKGLDGVPLIPHQKLIPMYEAMAGLRHPCRVIGIAINGRNVSEAEAEQERSGMAEQFGLPVCDVYRHGAAALASAVLQLRSDLSISTAP